MAVLPTNYLDDILAASMGGKRRFRITHEDGSTEEVTLEDVSEYEQVGSPFGSGDVNKTNQAVNEKLDSADVVDPALATVLGFAADAKLTGDALSELTKKFVFQFFNNLADLGLSQGSSAIDVVRSLPTGSILLFEIVYNSGWISSGMPDGYLNGGLLEIIHLGSRYIIRFTRQSINSIATPDLYLGSVASSNPTEITWKKVTLA